MAWNPLREDYTDAVWDGLKKYNEISNPDGTVSFQDVTQYTGKEKSFFGSKDANQMNGAINNLMDLKENGQMLRNPNLLHNWYFANPINQRGQSEYTGSAITYGIDRWFSARAVLHLTEGGLSIVWDGVNGNTGYIAQRIENGAHLSGKTVTASLMIDEELCSVTGVFPAKGGTAISTGYTLAGNTMRLLAEWPSNSNFPQVAVASNTTEPHTILAVKLELGSTQTLAHKEGDTWVLNDPAPDPQQELAKCQRYYQIVGGITSGFARSTDTTTSLIVLSVPVSVAMRINPSASLVTGTSLVTYDPADNEARIIATSDIGYMHGGVVDLNVTVDRALTGLYKPILTGPELSIALDANL